MLYVENAIPENLPDFKKRDALRLRASFKTDAYEMNGTLRWLSNKRVVPLDCFDDAYCSTPPRQQTAYDAETEAFINDYRANHMNRTLNPEEQFELRAAFGPDETVVDVLTGQRFAT